MAVSGEWRFNDFVVQFKAEIETELLALSQQLTGLVQKYAPTGGNSHLGGSFEGKAVDFPGGLAVEIGSPLEYGAYVEWGTKPHWAPLQPLIEWVEQKIQPHVLAVGINFDSGRALPNANRRGSKILQGDARKRAVLKIARAVQMKIAMKGTKAQLFMSRALNEMNLAHEWVDTATGRYYQVDVTSWLEKNLDGILERSTRGLEV